MTPELSIVLPFYNQADHLVDIVHRYVSMIRRRPWEIVLVPNACRDESPLLCRRLAKRHRMVRSVENPAGGWGLSVRVGLAAARGRFLSYTNSARTDPATVPRVFDLQKSRPGSLAKVRRFGRSLPLREIGSLLYNLECRLLFGVQSGDVNGTPKIFTREAYGRMRLTSDGDLLDAEVLAWCRRLGVPVAEMPLAGFERHGGKSTTSLKSAARMYLGAVKLKWSMP